MKSRKLPVAGEFYRHFKGNLYQIIGIAKHSETLEQLVVYQALYGDYSLYVRPLDMFLEPVDKEKYPEAAQEYRFEQWMPGGAYESNAVPRLEKTAFVENTVARKSVSETITESAEAEDTGETVREEILRFLDAEGAEAKLTVLRELRRNLDESLLTTIELSMDLLPDDRESLERRYALVEQTLEKRVRFEGGRLR